MYEQLISFATVIAFIAFSADLIIQIYRVYRRKSSNDISARGTVIRTAGSLIILLKFINVDDPYLITGQIIITATIVTYLLMIVKYRKPERTITDRERG